MNSVISRSTGGRWLLGLCCAVVVAGLLVLFLVHHDRSCSLDSSGLPTCAVSFGAITSHPEATLLYPQSTLLSPYGSAEQHFLGGDVNAAYAGEVAATTVSSSTVLAWYDTWLVQHGWKLSPIPAALTGAETFAKGYGRGSRESFVIAIDDPTETNEITIPKAFQNDTVYTTVYGIAPYKQ